MSSKRKLQEPFLSTSSEAPVTKRGKHLDTKNDGEKKKQPSPVAYHALRISANDADNTKEAFLKQQSEFKAWLSINFDQWVFQCELGEGKDGKPGRYHFQCSAHSKRKRRSGEVLKRMLAAFPGRSCWCAPEADFAYSNYCIKKETHVDGPWADRPMPVAYRGNDIETKLTPWQQSVADIISTPPDKRTVNWVYDVNGSAGKTSLGKYLEFHQLALVLTYGKADNLINTVYTMPTMRCYMFDLTRCKPTDMSGNDLYSSIENIKNGSILNMKYTCGKKLFDPPHIWCFSNQLPQFAALSKDRWKIWTIEGGVHGILTPHKGS